jgi:prolyl 4-hydroxylase
MSATHYEHAGLAAGARMLRLVELPNVLSPAQCERLIEAHAGELAPSLVGYTERTRAPHPARTSSSAKLAGLPADVAAELEQRLEALTGLPRHHAERWELIRYGAGERYKLHHDLRAPGDNARRFSALVYLRSPLAGGETVFPFAGRIIRPRAGLLVCWANTTPDGTPLGAAAHEALPVRGEKWCLATWLCEQPFELDGGSL